MSDRGLPGLTARFLAVAVSKPASGRGPAPATARKRTEDVSHRSGNVSARCKPLSHWGGAFIGPSRRIQNFERAANLSVGPPYLTSPEGPSRKKFRRGSPLRGGRVVRFSKSVDRFRSPLLSASTVPTVPEREKLSNFKHLEIVQIIVTTTSMSRSPASTPGGAT